MLRKRTVVVAALVALGVTAPAQAVTLRTPMGTAADHVSQWAAQAQMPVPPIALTVVRESCPGFDDGYACTDPDHGTMWLPPHAFRTTFLHELGHQVDYHMRPGIRTRFEALLHDDRPWRSARHSPHEQFAEAWSLCAAYGYDHRPRDHRAWRRFVLLYHNEMGYEGYRPPVRTHLRVCRMIARRTGSWATL